MRWLSECYKCEEIDLATILVCIITWYGVYNIFEGDDERKRPRMHKTKGATIDCQREFVPPRNDGRSRPEKEKSRELEAR